MQGPIIAAVIAAAVLTFPVPANPHGGGLDSMGCHHNRKAGGYHCHRGPVAGQSFGSKSEARRAMQGGSAPRSSPAVVAPIGTAAIVGRASIVDGDTIEVRGQRIRFHGIDAPESGQLCSNASGDKYRCGQQAALALADKIGQRPVTCERKDVDRYTRVIAVCHVGSEDLNGWLVSEGWAIAYRRYAVDYVGQEEAAKGAKRGIWSGAFVVPEEWRRGKRANQAPTSAAPRVAPQPVGSCDIKGNISRNGRIYHVPSGQYYSRTRIDEFKGERWFCSEEDAVAAGWRKSLR